MPKTGVALCWEIDCQGFANAGDKEQVMKIGVMGAGGLGGFIGGRLALEGHDVAFVARGQHLKAIHQTGLRVQSPSGDFKIDSPKSSDNPAEVGAVDLIFFCVKSYDATEAIEMMKPMVGPQTVVLPVLNGVEHIEHLADRLGKKHVLGGLALMVANIVEPGQHYPTRKPRYAQRKCYHQGNKKWLETMT
jgi:2-dehydropantoate 2-reductase